MRWFLAVVHLLGLGVGLGAVYARARALRGTLDLAGLRRVFLADTWWGVAAALWIVSGAVRAFGGYEKGTDFYFGNHLFLAKMGALVLILILEIGPIIRLGQWRRAVRQGTVPDTQAAARYAGVSTVQAVLVILMVIAATGMARGYGMGTP